MSSPSQPKTKKIEEKELDTPVPHRPGRTIIAGKEDQEETKTKKKTILGG